MGDDEWPRWGFRFAGDCMLVFGGDLARAGGKRLPFMNADGAGPVAEVKAPRQSVSLKSCATQEAGPQKKGHAHSRQYP